MSTGQDHPVKKIDLTKAKAWCDRARAILGTGYIPYSEDRQMHLRNEQAATGLKSLEETNSPEFQRLALEYKTISKEAKAAALAEDAELSRRVSAELEILNLEIKDALNGLSSTEVRHLFEKQQLFVRSQLSRLEQVADADTHRKLTTRVDDFVTEATTRGDYATGAANLKVARVDLDREIRTWTGKLKNWNDKAVDRKKIQQAAELLSEDSPYRQKTLQLLAAADDMAQRVRDFTRAELLITQCEQVIREQQEYEAPIREKMRAFEQGDPAFIELADAVKKRLDRLLKVFGEKQVERRRPKPEANAYQVLGTAGTTYLEAWKLAEGFRQRIRQGSLEAWGGYPEFIDEAVRQLEDVKSSLDELIKSPTLLEGKAIDLVHEYQAQQMREKALKAWAEEKVKTQEALRKLAACAGPASQETTSMSDSFQQLVKKLDGEKNPYDPKQLRKLTRRIEQVVEEFSTRRELLQQERNRVKDKWNELLEEQDVFPESYYDGISDEYDKLNVYLDSPNLAIVEIGLQKRRELLTRFEKAIAEPDKIKEGAETFDKLTRQLASNEKSLSEFQPTRLAEHKFVQGELQAVVTTEDPSTLLPKLAELQLDLNESVRRAALIKQTRTDVKRVVDELKLLYARLLNKYKELGKDIPKDYKCSYEQVAERHINSALALEDNALAQQHKQRLDELKSKLETLLQSDVDIGRQYDDVETKHVQLEKERRQVVEQQKREYEQALSNFQSGLFQELKSKRGGPWFLPTIYGTDPLNAVTSMLGQANSEAGKEHYESAQRALRQAIATSKSLLAEPESGSKNQSLEGIGKPWEEALSAASDAIAQLVNTIRQQCASIKQETPEANPDDLLSKVQQFPSLLDGWEGTEFDAFITKILDPKRSDQKAQAEQALQLVRKRIGSVESDPLLLKLAGNPFGVRIPRLALVRALRSLELALVTVQ